MIRVLVLHGYAESAEIFKRKMNAIQQACGENVEFVFLDAPVLLDSADIPQIFSSYQRGALDMKQALPDPPELRPRAWWKDYTKWWKADPSISEYYHVAETIDYLGNYLKNQRFNGIFGFSQGAGMAAALAKILEQPALYPSILVDGKPPHPPFEFCVLVSGVKPRDIVLDPLFSTPLTTPSLHIMGRKDKIIAPGLTWTLVNVCKDPRVVEHEGGHFVPSRGSWPTFFKEYLLSYDPASSGRPVLSSVPAPHGETLSQSLGPDKPDLIPRVGVSSKL